MVYAALLRGINVGGNNKVEMARLKHTFESVGFENVKTYINSGNIIFTDESRPKGDIETLIEQGILRDFKLSIKVLVRDLPAMQKLNTEIPSKWQNDTLQRTDVMFLWDDVDSPEIVKSIPAKPDIETIKYVRGAVLWNIGRKNVKRGAVVRIIGSDIYRKMTIRNVNTVRKLLELMQSV